jgi:hypothetical protein
MDGVALHCGATWVRRGTSDPSQYAIQEAEKNCAFLRRNKELPMTDLLMLALALIFFAAAIGYTYACERL